VLTGVILLFLKHWVQDLKLRKVPVLIHGDVRCDLVEKYSERSCARGDLGRICGLDLLNILFDLSDKQELFGA